MTVFNTLLKRDHFPPAMSKAGQMPVAGGLQQAPGAIEIPAHRVGGVGI
jgi:hypothetical protein